MEGSSASCVHGVQPATSRVLVQRPDAGRAAMSCGPAPDGMTTRSLALEPSRTFHVPSPSGLSNTPAPEARNIARPAASPGSNTIRVIVVFPNVAVASSCQLAPSSSVNRMPASVPA